MEKIAKVSWVVRGLIALIAVGHVATFVYMLAFQSNSLSVSIGDDGISSSARIEQQISRSGSWSNFSQELESEGFNSIAILFGPELLFYGFIYITLFRLFGLYKLGHIFTSKSVQMIRNIGVCVLCWPVFTVLYPTLVTLTLRLSGASENLAITIGAGTDEVIKLIAGLIIFVIGWIMSEAQKLLEEQELTI